MTDMVRLVELAQQGFYCSQILLAIGLEAQGKEGPDLIRAMAGLAGGLGFSGDVCGALSGGVSLLGLFAGRGTPEEVEDSRLNVMVVELVEWFAESYGRVYGDNHCEHILGEDPRNRTTRCPQLILGVLEKVESLLAENEIDISRREP